MIRYVIRYQWRKGFCAPGDDPHDWRSWRIFAAIPILFSSREDAQFYLDIILGDTFKNLRGKRKISCSIDSKTIGAKA